MPQEWTEQEKQSGAAALLQASGATAVQVILSLMQDEGVKPELRLKAAESILDRLGGKSTLAGEGGAVSGAIKFEGELEEWSR